MKLGNITLKNRLILAPMAGISDYPFRVICRSYGCNLVYSEMISSEGLIRGSEKTFDYLYKGAEEGKDGNYIAFQIFGDDPSTMAEAAAIVEERGADIVDINMGCPVKKVVKTGAGSALLGDLKKTEKIILAIKKKINIPLTVKIRSGWKDKVNVLEASNVLYNSGADGITIHPRTQKQGFSGKADINLIKKVKEQIDLPIIASGDIKTYEDFLAVCKTTDCDAVMIGRASMGNPWIFSSYRSGSDYLPDANEMRDTIKKHLSLSIKHYGKDKGIRLMRKHIGWYTRGLDKSKALREKIYTLTESEDIIYLLDKYFAKV